MIIKAVGFDWDDANIAKCEKHGVLVHEIEAFFERTIHILGDAEHSRTEERFVAVGRSLDGRGMFVGFTFRDGSSGRLIRPITARFMHMREIEKYDKAIAKIDE